MKRQIIFIIMAILMPVASLNAAVTSVTLTPASPTTLSNGNSYYLAGIQYDFIVQAVDPVATGKSYWNQITLTFPGGQTCTVSIDTDTVVGLPTGIVVDTITDNTPPSPYTNIDYTLRIRFLWTATEYPVGSNAVQATVTCDLPDSRTTTSTFLHGLCSTIRVVNFLQNQNGAGGVPGVAADGYVNPWHSSFRVTGVITYNVTGATSADSVYSKDAAEITSTTLLTDNLTTYLGGDPGWREDDDVSNNCSYTVPVGTGTLGLGNHTWTIIVTMQTTGGPVTSSNSLTLNCDRIRVDTITFLNGGGITAPPTYYRSVNIPGTQIHIYASRESGAAGVLSMIGNTTFTVRNITNNQNFTLTITNGDNGTTSGIGNVPYPSTLPVNGTTEIRTYQVMKITGSAFDNEQDLDIGAGRITQTPVNPVILWDRNDPPGTNGAPGVGQTPFTTETSFIVTPSATYADFVWQPVTALGTYEGDFYSYRIYYRETNIPANPWTIVDRSTLGYGPTGTYPLSDPARTTARITGLTPFMQYDYFMTAVDVFGQEVEHPIPSGNLSDALYDGAPNVTGYGQFTTNPTSIEASVTDGITNYTFTQFASTITASTRPLRKSSLRVSIFIVSSGDQPDSVNIILSQDNGTGAGIPVQDLYPIPGTSTWDRISCSKSAPNTWTAYIPSTNRFLTENSYCRFIIESVRGGTPTYSDIDSTTDADPNDYEYTFWVHTPTTFQPWPTRILNNVLTDKNPVCYPSYYLSDDAYVTIKAYDVKGRPVATLIDNGFRKGGQNIKEGGWSGDNKSRKMLGVGLYYIRFEAKRTSDGKVILNETEKVVIAK
jgi:hypothetical protein